MVMSRRGKGKGEGKGIVKMNMIKVCYMHI
jgi:hypothetical protein